MARPSAPFCNLIQFMALFGITGGMGAGKTTVLSLLGELGARVTDADDVVHALYAPGAPCTRLFRERWGAGVLDATGAVDRRQVAARVFADPAERAWLNQVIHPQVRERFKQEEQAAGTLFAGVPLLYEAGWEADFAAVIAVWSPAEVVRERLRARGWSAAEIAAREAAQLPADEKLRRADHAIINNSSLERLRDQCRLLLSTLT